MFHRVGPAAYKPNLDNTLALTKALGNPHLHLRCIHIAGTNGKGSCSHMLASILQEAGLKTGLYTSPHLKDFRERIRINGEMISEDYMVQFVNRYRSLFDDIHPSFFEMSTILAFYYFHEKRTDIAVIETGLGGRLDSTNIINPMLSVITNIGPDHMNLLGDTLEKIAVEKAGIIKAGIPVVIGESQRETYPVFIEKAASVTAPAFIADKTFSLEVIHHNLLNTSLSFSLFKEGRIYLDNVQCSLTGIYQLKNILTVIQAIDVLRKDISISDTHIRNGLRNVNRNTGLQGRWQILSHQPLVICDTGHNEPGIREVTGMLNKIPHQQLHFVLGVVDDKDLSKMLGLLPAAAVYYFCKASIPRGLDATLLREKAAAFGLKGEVFSSVKSALDAAIHQAGEQDIVFVGGSTFTVAEII